jgi:hypothetical protein
MNERRASKRRRSTEPNEQATTDEQSMQQAFQRAAAEVSRLYQQGVESQRARERARALGRAEQAEHLASLLQQQRNESESVDINELVHFLLREASALRADPTLASEQSSTSGTTTSDDPAHFHSHSKAYMFSQPQQNESALTDEGLNPAR